MLNWLDDVAGPNYAPALLWTFAALLLLIVVLIIIRLIRGLTFGTFVAGGRNRKTRLAVMDATAVDSHRRLVLVRRDDIEHLLLIGGPTDVVVERDIRLVASRRPLPAGEVHAQQPAPPAAAVRQQHAAPPPARPVPARPHAPAPPPAAAAPLREPLPRPAPLRAPAPSTPHGQDHTTAARPKSPPPDDPLDDALLNELEVSLDEPHPPAKPGADKPASLEDEMTRLLGELSSHKR
ncbi:MAG: flagellar biosynthetic protein FliO [Mesorhizobium sp.]|nr:flagellar biosynthetic protein FliO [Mesorhizobium sp.]MBN9242696.1 flagellar biosynthetic protein FliO [Mesorhizobium sp.]MBN9271921.1 flagellar biosynthetic protein FliO [Mesorhizobium sp.]